MNFTTKYSEYESKTDLLIDALKAEVEVNTLNPIKLNNTFRLSQSPNWPCKIKMWVICYVYYEIAISAPRQGFEIEEWIKG
jgi:hypothetical protein